jgi:hypothetical protein
MRTVRLLAMTAWQLWFWFLPAQARGLPPAGGRPEAASIRPMVEGLRIPGHGPRPLRLFKRLPGPQQPECPCPCLAALPGSGPAAPHWHGRAGVGAGKGLPPPLKTARNLVVEVRRIELSDAFGAPRGTFR